jgi:hypothetical protein
MSEQITLEQALELVSFMKAPEGDWKVLTVWGDVSGDVYGHVRGNVNGKVLGKINGRSWESVETPREKLERLIQESGDQELIEAFNQQQEDN